MNFNEFFEKVQNMKKDLEEKVLNKSLEWIVIDEEKVKALR